MRLKEGIEMCLAHNPRVIDKCMKKAIATLSIIFKHNGFRILACCCGHNKYPTSIVYKIPLLKTNYELFSGKVIPRKKRFYVKDKQGYYFIPEVEK